MLVKMRPKKNKGLTIIEGLISVGVFVMIVMLVNETAVKISSGTKSFRDNTAISGLADQYLEIARNLPYSQIGTANGNPHGNLPDEPNAQNATVNGHDFKVYYVVNYIDDPADGTAIAGTDITPNDYKQIKLYIENVATGVTRSFLSNIAPKGLESLNGGGTLSVKVFDSVGQPVPNATVHIVNTTLSPDIDLTRTTDSQGNWIEVGLPPSANSYSLTATKTGYSTDQTYPVSVGNPNPVKSDATILDGQVTQISFSIDKTSTLLFKTLDQTCNAISGISLGVRGSKLIGTPSVLKFNNSYTTDSNGQTNLTNLEWDNYTPAIASSDKMIYGSSPIQQISVLPNTNQTFTLVLGPKTTNSLLVIVKDASTGNAIEGATVELRDEDNNIISTKVTAGSIWNQLDWSGGNGQTNFTDATKYDSDDTNIDYSSGVKLANYGGAAYASSGTLTSSTFDTGTNASSYTNLTWQPTSQDPATQLKFQIATNDDNATWNFVGPDGTASTYFTVPGTNTSNSNDNKRYIRYKLFLSTTDTSKTPILTSVGINYVSGCFTPGQTIFTGLSSNEEYSVTTSLAGYQTQTVSNLDVDGYQVLEVLLTP